MRSTSEIRKELHEAEAAEAATKAALVAATPIVWKFTITPADSWATKDLFDPTCRVYKLFGDVLNKDELKAVGRSYSTGGMNYVFNTLSGKLVMPVGGGYVWVSRGYCDDDSASAELAMLTLSDYLAVYPEGGDVTEIVLRHMNSPKLKDMGEF